MALILMLISQAVSQAQLYALPAGLYIAAIGVLEQRRGPSVFATYLESFGLTVLLLTSFVQSLNGDAGFPYFLLLLVEALLVVWWGASRHERIPFFIGLGASVLNVSAQLIVLINVYDVNRWIVILGTGLFLVVGGIFIERKWDQILTQTQEWRTTLTGWH